MQTKRSPVRVGLFGTFDTPNFGDCLFPLIVRQQISRRVEDAEVLAFSPTGRVPSTGDYSRVYAFSELGGAFEEACSGFVIGGGALLSTEHVLFSYPDIRLVYPYSLKCWLLPAMVARAWKIPLILNAVGIGPFDPAYNTLASRYLGGADLLCVRDGLTASYLKGLGVSPEIVPDSGILTPDLQSEAEWDASFRRLKERFSLPEKFVAVQASLYLGPHLERFAAAVADAVRGTGLPAVFVPVCHHLNDLVSCNVMRKVFECRGVKTKTIGTALKSLETCAVLRHASLYVGTSLHGALVTLAFGNPALSFSLNSMKKNRSVLDALGLGGCCIHEVGELGNRIASALESGPGQHEAALRRARGQLAVFFDRGCDVLTSNSQRGASHPAVRISGGAVFCEGIQQDLDNVKRISAEYCRQIPFLRRIAAFAIRNNRTASELYDRVVYETVKRQKETGTP